MKRFLIVVSLVFAFGNSYADNIEGVLRQVEENNLSLKALWSENEAQVLDVQSENALSGPSIEYSPFYGSGYSGVAESELIVSEEIQFPTKYAARNKQAKLQEQVGYQQYKKLRREILLEAQQTCIDVIRVNQTLKMLNQRLSDSKSILELYEKRMAAGDANILEFNKVKLDCYEVMTMVTEAQNERAMLLQQLEALNGGNPVDITDTEMPEYEMISDYHSYLALVLATDTDIQMAEALLNAASQEEKIQKNEWLPNISLGYRRNTDRKEYVNGVLVGVSFPIISNSKKVKAARQRKESAELQVEQARQEAASQLKTRYQQLVGFQKVLDHSDVRMMEESLDLWAKALLHGEIDAITYYGEIHNLYEKLQRHIDVHCLSTKLLAELHKNEL